MMPFIFQDISLYTIIVLALPLTLALLYFFLGKKPVAHRQDKLSRWFAPTRYHLSILCIVIGLMSYFLNRAFQVFCQPVTWAAVVLLVSWASICLYPLVKERNSMLDNVL